MRDFGPQNVANLEAALRCRRQDVVRALDGMLERREVVLADAGVRLKTEPTWRITAKGRRMAVEYERTADYSELLGLEHLASRLLRQLGSHFRQKNGLDELRAKATELRGRCAFTFAEDIALLEGYADQIERRREMMRAKSAQKGGALAPV